MGRTGGFVRRVVGGESRRMAVVGSRIGPWVAG